MPFSTNSSARSLSRLSRSQKIRYVRSTGRLGACGVSAAGAGASGAEETSVGTETLWERWLEKRSSSPPPNSILREIVDMGGRQFVSEVIS